MLPGRSRLPGASGSWKKAAPKPAPDIGRPGPRQSHSRSASPAAASPHPRWGCSHETRRCSPGWSRRANPPGCRRSGWELPPFGKPGGTGRRRRRRWIALIGVELDDHATVHHRPVVGIGVLRVVGMHRMGVVRRDQEAPGQSPAVMQPHAGANPHERIRQEGGVGALLGVGAHLLVVKDTAHWDALPLPGLKEALQAGPGALQVVQGPGGEVLPLRAPDSGLFPVVQE